MTTLQGGVTYNAVPPQPFQNIAERAAGQREFYDRLSDNISANIRVAMPAQVISFDASKQTIVAQPLIKEKIINRANGTIEWVQIAPIADIPVHYPQGGGFVLTFPIKAGDEVMLVFQDLCMDSWWYSGGVQNWNDARRHDLSDAIAIPGINSVPNVIPAISSTATELRSKDGTNKVSIDESGNINVTATTTLTLTAPIIDINGVLNVNGGSFASHEHTGVTTGSANTGGVYNP